VKDQERVVIKPLGKEIVGSGDMLAGILPVRAGAVALISTSPVVASLIRIFPTPNLRSTMGFL